VRPADEAEVAALKKKDAYGHHKLAGEEVLDYYQRLGEGFPWVALRLADVIGAWYCMYISDRSKSKNPKIVLVLINKIYQ
jgi:nucleoside-diphosphate-sugar epimerase